MEAPVEIRYAGVVIGQAQESRGTSNDNLSFFISLHDPMPVGSVLRLRSGDREVAARVMHVIEAPDSAGMSVRLLDDAEVAAAEYTPPPVVVARPTETAPAQAVPVQAAPAEAAPAEAAPMNAVPAEVEATTSPDLAAVPEAVPVAIGSSLTGALEKAAETGVTDPPQDSGAIEQTAQPAGDSSGNVAEAKPVGEELPPARPISNPTGRRKSKRRK